MKINHEAIHNILYPTQFSIGNLYRIDEERCSNCFKLRIAYYDANLTLRDKRIRHEYENNSYTKDDVFMCLGNEHVKLDEWCPSFRKFLYKQDVIYINVDDLAYLKEI